MRALRVETPPPLAANTYSLQSEVEPKTLNHRVVRDVWDICSVRAC